ERPPTTDPPRTPLDSQLDISEYDTIWTPIEAVEYIVAPYHHRSHLPSPPPPPPSPNMGLSEMPEVVDYTFKFARRNTSPISLSVILTPSYAPKSDFQEIIYYEDEDEFAKVANEMNDECDIYYFCGVLYNMPSCSKRPKPAAPFICVSRGRYIGVFSGWDNVKPIVNGVRNALYSEVNSLEDGERRVRRAIEMGAAFIITQECSICGGVIHCQGSAAIACFF
ncbi:hypothetical protein M405DRAFT_842533, partial [Rhizopogon salebrosus TDB-379]